MPHSKLRFALKLTLMLSLAFGIAFISHTVQKQRAADAVSMQVIEMVEGKAVLTKIPPLTDQAVNSFDLTVTMHDGTRRTFHGR